MVWDKKWFTTKTEREDPLLENISDKNGLLDVHKYSMSALIGLKDFFKRVKSRFYTLSNLLKTGSASGWSVPISTNLTLLFTFQSRDGKFKACQVNFQVHLIHGSFENKLLGSLEICCRRNQRRLVRCCFTDLFEIDKSRDGLLLSPGTTCWMWLSPLSPPSVHPPVSKRWRRTDDKKHFVQNLETTKNLYMTWIGLITFCPRAGIYIFVQNSPKQDHLTWM